MGPTGLVSCCGGRGWLPSGLCLSQGWFLSYSPCSFLPGCTSEGESPASPALCPAGDLGSFSSPRLQKVKPRPLWLHTGSRCQQRLSLRTKVSWAGLQSEQCAPTSYPLQHHLQPCAPSSLWIREQGVPRPKAGHRLMPQKGFGGCKCPPWIAGNSSKVMLVVIRVNKS